MGGRVRGSWASKWLYNVIEPSWGGDTEGGAGVLAGRGEEGGERRPRGEPLASEGGFAAVMAKSGGDGLLYIVWVGYEFC